MPTLNRSFVTPSGEASFKHTGRYNEFTKEAKHSAINDAPSSLTQKRLAQGGSQTAAARTTRSVKEKLGL